LPNNKLKLTLHRPSKTVGKNSSAIWIRELTSEMAAALSALRLALDLGYLQGG